MTNMMISEPLRPKLVKSENIQTFTINRYFIYISNNKCAYLTMGDLKSLFMVYHAIL